MDICARCHKAHAHADQCTFCGVTYCKQCIQQEQPSTPAATSFYLSKYFPPFQTCSACYLAPEFSLRNRHYINNIIQRDQTGWMNFWRGRWPYHFLFCGEIWGIWTLHELWTQMLQGQISITNEMDDPITRDELKQPRTIAIANYSDLHIDAPGTIPVLTKYVGCDDLSELILSFLVVCDRCRPPYISEDPNRMKNVYFEVKKPTEYIKAPDIADVLCQNCFELIELCEFCTTEHKQGHMKRCWNDGCGIRTCQECTQSFQHLSHEENCLVLSRYEAVKELMQQQSWMTKETGLASCRGYFQMRFSKLGTQSRPIVYELRAMNSRAT